MANAQLIQVAKNVYDSQGFTDFGEDFEGGFQVGLDAIEKAREERKLKREQADARVATYMDKIPSRGLDKIPQYAQKKVSTFLNEGRANYAKHANALRNLDPQDSEYQEHVDEMNLIKRSFDNLNNQFTTLGEEKLDYLEASDNRVISYGNTPEDLDFLSSVFTDATDMKFDKNGNIIFNKEGNELYMDDLPKWIVKDTKLSEKLLAEGQKIYNKGSEFDPAQEASAKKIIKTIITSNGRDGLVSLAADDMFEDKVVNAGIDVDLFRDPTRTEELTEVLTNMWFEVFKTQAKAGEEKKNKLIKSRRAPRALKTPTYPLDGLFDLPNDPLKQNQN